MTWLSDRAVDHLQQVATWPDLTGLRYTALEEIGRGGMGVVYRAHDNVLARDVALKVINAVGPQAALGARLEHEAHVLARLEHPGIVPVHDSGTLADGRTFYVMKLVNGAALPDHLATLSRLDERLRIFERICEPVAFAHASGLVHRDLKPANVMVGSFGEVLVLDWGLAKVVAGGAGATQGISPMAAAPTGPRSLTEAGAIVGTRGYMAPEQARAAGEVDARADVYALGAVLVSMLTNEAPDGSSASTASALEARRMVVRLRAICQKALADAPGDRYADAAALAEDVARFRAGLPVAAHRETRLEIAARFVSMYRTPILLLVGYLVMRALVALYIGYS